MHTQFLSAKYAVFNFANCCQVYFFIFRESWILANLCFPVNPLHTSQGASSGGSFHAGQPATLQCNFSAVGRPTAVTWFLNGTQLIDSNSHMAVQSDGSLLATYTVSAVGAPTAGQYTCQGSNANGTGAYGPNFTVAVKDDCELSNTDVLQISREHRCAFIHLYVTLSESTFPGSSVPTGYRDWLFSEIWRFTRPIVSVESGDFLHRACKNHLKNNPTLFGITWFCSTIDCFWCGDDVYSDFSNPLAIKNPTSDTMH